MTSQESIQIRSRGRGTYNITDAVAEIAARSGVQTGWVNVFVRHTSCSLIITENADPDVRHDLETLAGRWAPDGDTAYRHDCEGDDDMAAHARSVLTDVSLTIPVGNGRLLLGTWQGVFLWEHRARPHQREIIVTVSGD